MVSRAEGELGHERTTPLCHRPKLGGIGVPPVSPRSCPEPDLPTPPTHPAVPERTRRLVSFDGGVSLETIERRPDRYRHLLADLDRPRIARGAGLSYAAASFAPGTTTIDHRSFDRVLAIDDHLITVEPGITLGKLFRVLERRGLYLPTQPGSPAITVGGCVATDVHGKNQARDGTFVEQVESLRLFHPRHGEQRLSRDENPDLFDLTCGGFGLTGQITEVTLRAKPAPKNALRATFVPVSGLAEAGEVMQSHAAKADLVFSWHDATKGHDTLGPGFVQLGTFDAPPALQPVRRDHKALSPDTRAPQRLPLLNALTTRAMNAAFRFKTPVGEAATEPDLFAALFPIHGVKEAYFHLYGARGFHEHQCLIPAEAAADFEREARCAAKRHAVPITLASGKWFDRQDNAPALLRFTGRGAVIAINCPRTAASRAFLADLDRIMLDAKGRPNLIKDSRLPRAVVEEAMPEALADFRERLLAHDPERLYQSELSERLAL